MVGGAPLLHIGCTSAAHWAVHLPHNLPHNLLASAAVETPR
jgi:hypothetical protein